MNCSYCGSLNADEWEKCVICGSPLHQSSSSSPEQYVLLYKRPEEMTWRRWPFSSLEKAKAMARHFQARGFETRIMYLRPKPRPVERRRRILLEEVWREVELARQGSHSNPYVVDAAKALGIVYAEKLTPIPILEKNLIERVWLASAIDHDGSLGETRTYIQRKVDTIYRYWYQTPHITYTTTTISLADKFYMLTREKPTIERRAPPRPQVYRFSITWSKAIALIIYMKPYLIREAKKADELLAKYKERPAIPIRTERIPSAQH